ncbi:hypothetical protein [Streptomyces sp. GbtcB6]|nr:hypothetical protein [Streptomyces sp. GbtcB6]
MHRSSKSRQGGPLRLTGAKGVYAVHAAGPVPEQLADAARALDAVTGAGAFPGTATVLVGAGFDDTDALSDLLEPALEECRAAGTTLLRMVMSGGAVDIPERPSPARRIADRWGLDVLAPAGVAMVVPGGTLFAPDLPDAAGGWWQFSPARQPRGLGPRHPEPGWQSALDRVAPNTAPGCVIEHIPAGLLIQPAEAPAEGADAIRYALPVDPDGPVLLVDTTGTAPVPADALADTLAALPAPVRSTVRLVSCDGGDLLAVGQEVADLLGTEVQVAGGLPLLLDEPRAAGRSRGDGGSPWGGPGGPGGPGHGGTARTVLLDAAGNPSWQPYIRTVTCRPADGAAAPPAPRIGTWRAPIGGLSPAAETGTLLLDREWQVTVTRAGLWIGPQGTRLPAASANRAVRAEVMTVDIGVPGRTLDDSLLAPLEHLLGSLQDDIRTHTLIQLLGDPTPGTLRALRRLAVRHDLALTSQAQQPTGTAAAVPGSRGVTATGGTGTGTGTGVRRRGRTGTTGAGGPAGGTEGEATGLLRGTAGEPVTEGAVAGEPVTQGAVPAAPARGGYAPPVPDPTTLVSAPPAPATPLGVVGADPGGSGDGTPAGPRTASAVGPAGGESGTASAAALGVRRSAEGTGGGPRSVRLGDGSSTGEPVTGRVPSGAAPDGPDAVRHAPVLESPETAEPPRSGAEQPVTEPSVPEPSVAEPAVAEPAVAEPSMAGAPLAEPAAPEAAGSGWPPAGQVPAAERAPWPPLPPAARDTGTDTVAGLAGLAAVTEEELGLPMAPMAPMAGLMSSAPPHTEPPAAADSGGTAPERAGAGPDGPGLRSVAWLPVRPSHRSSEAERDAVRTYLGERWDHHGGAVTRALTRLPALRDSEHPEEAAADLAALHSYLTADAGAHRALLESLEAGGTELLPLLGCVTSGLRRLPSYRGAAVRSAGGPFGERAELLLPGEELGEAVPVGAVAFDKSYPSVPADHYLIWSMTGRKAAAVLTEPEAGPGASGDSDPAAGTGIGTGIGTGVPAGEVLFAPGTRLRVLQSVRRAGATVVLLRELPESAPPSAPGRLDDADASVLKRLLALADLATAPPGGGPWPERCTGVLGLPAPDA